MSSLHIFILCIFLPIQFAENQKNYFTQSIYDIWCQENILSNSLFLYPNHIPGGIYHQSNIRSLVYDLIDNSNYDLFNVQTKRLEDFYFFILNITRPLDLNREYQNIYQFYIQANIITDQENITEQAEIHLHVADSNDNDGVFDMDIYEKNFSEPFTTPQLLLRFHASDADEIHHAQILYEISSLSLTDTFSLHPFTGELYLISKTNLQSLYEFDIYAYDRHRKYSINNNNNIKTKAHVKLRFFQNEILHRIKTIFNQTIEFEEIISSYEIKFFQNSNWNILNIHQPILIIKIFPIISSYEIFLLNNSSLNSMNLFLYQNQIYLNNHLFQEYNLHFLICFFNRTKCQYTNYNLIPSINFTLYQFHFKSIDRIILEENLPIHSFIKNIQLEYNDINSNQQLKINYKLLNYYDQFNLHPKRGILRLIQKLKYQNYSLEIQADIYLFNHFFSIKTQVEINVYEINKYRPIFFNETLIKLIRLPYQFQAFDFDENKQTNGRISYRLSNCFHHCPFEINPNNGLLNFRRNKNFIHKKIYYLQIIAFDWGEPISFETKLNITIDLSSKLIKRNLETRIDDESSDLSTNLETIYLNIGFKKKTASYHLSEDTEINSIIDQLNIEYDSFPLFINDEKDNLVFYIINDTSIPFIIDQNERTIKLINILDYEKQDKYTFEIEFQLKSSYKIKLHEIYKSNQKNRSLLNIQYSNKYYHKILFIIYINDINNHIPTCNDFHKSIILNENQIQMNIFHVQAFDPDRGENGTIIYSLLDYHQYFTINSYTGQINIIQPIDHEQISYLHLHIIASDQGQQPQLQSLCMTLHITIMDINDNIPQFSLINYTFHIFSDLPRATIFGQIYAFDKDSTDQLIYTIDSNPYIKINQHTGHLQLKSTIHQNLNLTVQVFDGLHINQTWIYLQIKHFPEPQEPILLSEPAYHITINQSLSIGTIVTNIYQYLQISKSSIDFIEIFTDQYQIPFSIDQQGSIYLIDSLTNFSNSSFWLPIRLTRYRAHPPHSFIYIHFTIHEDNFYLPQCINIYQYIKLYNYSITYPLVRIQALSSYNYIQLEYILINENIFSIDKQTGSIQFNDNLIKNDYLLTVRALDNQHQLFVDCFLKIHYIQKHQLIPKFYYSSIYNIDLVEISSNRKHLRQRLFQIIALLDHEIYNENLQIRYRIIGSQQDFIINRQTGYIAARNSLKSSKIYRLNIQAYTVAYTDKWRIVSSRIVLPVKIQILPLNIRHSSLVLTDKSLINIDLLTTTKVGSKLFQFEMYNNQTKWFIMISQIQYTQYFHVNFQSGDLILLRPIEELVNKTMNIELYINVTNDWIHMNTIKVIIHIKHDRFQTAHFSQTDYYNSISKTIPIGIEIARLTITNPIANCTYKIHSTERINSQEFFRINPYSGSITIHRSLEKSFNEKHLLNIIYYCPHIFHISSTRLHINILDNKSSINQQKNSYRFTQDNYLIIFETSLINQQNKYLMNFELINQKQRIQPDVQIIQGDPLGLFSIDSSNQSLVLIDESRTHSYIYPIKLIIIDTSQKEIINCTVTIFISNIAIQFTCPPINPSPYLFTYTSLPTNSIDLFTGQQYTHYNSITIHGFDSFTPSNLLQCSLENFNFEFSSKNLDFTFEKHIYKHIYNPQVPIHLSIKNLDNYSQPFDIIYQLINQTNQNSFQLDQHTGLIKYISQNNSLLKYSLLILAKYHSLITLTRLNIFHNKSEKLIYKFQLFRPFIDNYTIGYVKKKNFNSSIFSIDHTGRLFIQNSTLILPSKNSYEFFIDKSHVQINIYSKEIIQCSLSRLNFPNDDQLIGFIESFNHSKKQSFYLLNYNHLFILHHQHGLLYHRNLNQIIENNIKLLIEIEHARCFVTINGISSIPYLMIREENILDKFIDIPKQSSGQITLRNGTLVNFDIVSNYAPLFSCKSYTFFLDITNHFQKTIFVGRISAEPYNRNRSYLVYQFISSTKYFLINSNNGIIEHIPSRYYNKSIEQLQIIVRDLIYQENTTINLTIHIIKSMNLSLSSLIYYRTISEFLSPGSIIFEPNISTTKILHYSLQDCNLNLFTIDSSNGQVILIDYLSDSFYLLKIYISPINQILIIKLTVLDYNNHSPNFSNLPLNLTISSDDTFVTKLSAYDLDLFDNQNLKYYLLDRNQQKIFAINQTTGLITVKTLLPNQTYFQLKIGVSDGLYLTRNYLSIIIENYSKNSPKFSLNEYVFQYNKFLGQIFAYDSDPNDRIIYQLYLEPDGIQIDQYSGFITINKNLFFPIIEFFASASDRAKQIVYTKIKILYPIQPKFSSNLYHISLLSSIKISSEIFQFQLVNSFNQPLSSTRFEIDHRNFFEINENKLILKKKLSQSKIFYFNIYGYWNNFTCQTSIQIIFVEKIIKLNKTFYEFSIDKNHLNDNYFIEKFEMKNSLLKILSTPLTINDCHRNFYLKYNQLYFRNNFILSNLCFFELQLSNEKSIYSSLIKISFIDTTDFKPKFSSNIYYFHTNHIQVFAKSSNSIRYKLQANPYGLIINQTNGIIHSFNRIKKLDRIQLLVYAIDDKTGFNDTALIQIISNQKNEFQIPSDIPLCPNTPISISDRSLPGTIIQDIHQGSNSSNYYYILSGDTYGLFAITNLGKLYLVSSILNRTSEEYFELIILISSFSISYCRTNISIVRLTQWSYFICPPISIEWMIEEESPIGTRIGNVKDFLLMINNNSQLIDQIQIKFNDSNNDTQAFYLNSSTGLIYSNSRLDYEQKIFYSFSVFLEPIELNCSLLIRIKLININDNSIIFDQKSLIYTIHETYLLPFYLGRINLLNFDLFYSFQYKYFLTNSSSDISIDSTTGSIILLTQFNRKTHGKQLQYEIIVIDSSNQKNITDILRINIHNLIINNSIYFNLDTIHQCSIDSKNQFNNKTRICTIGKESIDFIYQLIDPLNLFDILSNNGTIFNRKLFNYEINQYDKFNVTIIVRNRKNQSIILSSLNLTIYLRNLNDQSDQFTTLLYLYYPSMNTTVYTIDIDQSNLTYEIINDTFSSYTLCISSNSIELILLKSIVYNREDNLIIRVWNTTKYFFDIKLHLIYHSYEIKFPRILTQTINGYVNFDDISSNINLGQLFIHNHSQYQFIYFQLISNKYFSLQQLSNNRTDLYFHTSSQSSFWKFQIDLITIAFNESISDIDFSKNTNVFLPLIPKSQSINIQLWSIDHELLNRTISIIQNINTTYEEFIVHNLPIVRQTFARNLNVTIDDVHIYTFELRENQIELLLTIVHSTSKEYLYNALKTTTTTDYCQSNLCENNASCISYIHLLNNQYTYFYMNTYQYLIPKYQWNKKCLCQNYSYGEYCQFQQESIYTPCSSNPCLPMEKCTDDLCNRKHSLNCININSPTCRDSSNILTFDGDSLIRMNSTFRTIEQLNITLSFRTHSTEGKLLQLIYYNGKTTFDQSIIIRIIDGYIKIEFNEKILLQLNDIIINDGLWHDIDFSIDNSYYLLRLDHVFSDRIILSRLIHSNNFLQLIIGTDYHGCLGNLSLNNQIISFQQQQNNNSLEFIGTTKDCRLHEIINDDLCSLYNPCYHGGICINHNKLSFSCNCSNTRFTGRQCQLDLYPCASNPCQFNEQCISLSSNANQTYRCIYLSITTPKLFYIGLILTFSLCIFFIIFIYYYYYYHYHQKQRKHFFKDTPFVSAPLLIHKSSTTKPINGTMQTLLKSQTLNRNEPMNSHIHYSTINYDDRNILQTTNLFHYNQRNSQIYINSLSNFPEDFDFDFTESSNDSSIIDQQSFLFNYDHIPTSTLSLSKTPIYAKIVKTPKMRNMLSSTPTSFITPIEIDDEFNELTINRLRHASDSDLLNERKSNKLSSFYQTDV